MAAMDLPANMTEEDVLQIVRELCGDDDMSDDELRIVYRSGTFHELCPDIEQYAKQRYGDGKVKEPVQTEGKSNHNNQNDTRPGYSGDRDVKTEMQSNHVKASKIKEEACSGSDSAGSRHNHHHHHHKKKKKKHSKDKKRDREDREKEERKEKVKTSSEQDREKPKSKPEPSKHQVINLVESSDSENERRKREERRKERKRKVYINSSSDESDHDKNKKNEHATKVVEDKKKDQTEDKGEDKEKPKIHSFYLEKSNNVLPSTSTKEKERESEKVQEKKKEPKPFSRYHSAVSKTSLRRWRPCLDKEHLKYQRRFRLKPVSVVCVDLLDMPMVFYNPRKPNTKSLCAVPLESSTTVSELKQENIRRLERDKANWYKKKLNRRAMKFLRAGKHKYNGSSDDDRRHKKSRIMDRLVSSSETNSDSSSVTFPSKKSKKDGDGHRISGKLTKAQKEAEMRKRKLEEIARKAKEQAKLKGGTRVLDWEQKDKYFKSSSIKKKEDPAKEKERLLAEKRKRILQKEKEREEKLKNAPSVSFQRILKQIESANKEQASKPKVELKIPKKKPISDRPLPISEYKLDGKIGVGDVYKEVAKLLASNVLVECPVLADVADDLGEYTVKKIAWWILKNEKDPAPEGLFHPECHDDDDQESIHSDDFDWPDDVSSINGCVSDPEGLAAEVKPDPRKVADPDWADDYCGEASLYARFRKETPETKEKQFPIDSVEPFKGFLRVKPGTNYSKPNFEVKCFLCSEVLRGQRQYGAHIRSDSHKNNFRNYSLDMANYEENVAKAPPQKCFVAQLVEYSANPNAGNATKNSTPQKPDTSAQTKLQVGKIEHVRSDSPGPIVAGDAAPNIMVHQMPIPDDISLPSMEDYDISSDESLMNVRVAIRTAGKWDDDLEKRWRLWRDEEAKIADEYNGERDYFINEPERHPNYQEEWMKFWERRCDELEAEGKDPESYDLQKEWMPCWYKRMQEIMKEKVEIRVAELKRRLLIDKHTLRARHGLSREKTKRRKKKKKYGKQDEENSSSLKSISKTDAVDVPPKQQLPSSTTHQRNENHKPVCLPTPPVTEEVRNRRGSSNSNESHTLPNREHKSEPRSKPNDKHNEKSRKHKHDDKHKRHKDKHDEKHSSRKDRHHKDDRDEKYHRHEDRDKKREHDQNKRSHCAENSRSHGSFIKREADTISSISSTEPPPPGEEPLLGSYSKAGRPAPPAISAPLSKQVTEVNERIDSELREKLGNRNESSRKPNENRDKHSHDKKHEPVKPKNTSSWTVNSDDDDGEPVQKRQRKDSGSGISSVSSNTRTLRERLQALREQLADEDSRASNNLLERPKIIPIEKTKQKSNLSDGEVASDGSDLVIDQGASTFFSKKIPGLNSLTKPAVTDLDKNSLGYHLLERKKSIDHPSSSNEDRSKHDRRDHRHSKSQHKDKGERRDSRDYPSSSSKHNDRNRHKNDHRGPPPKDDKRRWDTSSDNRNPSKDHRTHKDNDRGGSNHGHRHQNKDIKHNINNQPYKNSFNHNNNPPPTPFIPEESWEPTDSNSWEPPPTTPLYQPAPVPPFVPVSTNLIPVLDSTSRNPQANNVNNFTEDTWDSVPWGNQDWGNPGSNNYYY